MRGGKPRFKQEGPGAGPPGQGSPSRHSGSFHLLEGVGSLDTQSGTHSDDWADANTSDLPQGISKVQSPQVARNIGPKAASFPLPSLQFFPRL